MKYRKLGHTGMYVSAISFGTMFYGGAQYQATDNPVSKEDAVLCLKKAIESDINYLDCADIYGAYGNAENIIGEVIKDYERTDLVISSKVWFPMSSKVNNRGLSKKHIQESIHKTLERLNTDYLDLYYCHRYDYSTPLEETIVAMNDLIDQGKILYWGTSNWPAAQLERAYGITSKLGLRPPACDQVRYNLFLRYGLEIELPYTIEYYGLGTVVYKVLADGLLAGKYDVEKIEDLDEKAIQNLSHRIGGEFNASTLEKMHQLLEIAKDLDLTISQLAYAWVLKNPFVSTALMSTRKPERIEENLKIIDAPLDDESYNKINSILDNEPRPPVFYLYDSHAYYKKYQSQFQAGERGIFPPNFGKF
ncbi:MAG: aldo/keto reductase [Candidatus Hodarchaeota archaeon]